MSLTIACLLLLFLELLLEQDTVLKVCLYRTRHTLNMDELTDVELPLKLPVSDPSIEALNCLWIQKMKNISWLRSFIETS